MTPHHASDVDDTVGSALGRVHAESHGKSVRAGGGRDRPAGRHGHGAAGTPLDGWLAAARLGQPEAIAETLRGALSPRRWEPWNPYQEHRAYPSPRTAFVVDAILRSRDAAGVLDPVRDAVTAVPGGGELRPTPTDAEPILEVLLELHPERLADGYGALAEALAWLEGGHVAAALAESAGAAGVAMDWRMGDRGITVTLRPGGSRVWPWSRVLARRSSGLGPRGLAVDRRPLPPFVLAELAGAAAAVPPGSPVRHVPELHHRLAARGFAGTADGWYTVEDGAIDGRATAIAAPALANAIGSPAGRIDPAGMHAVWVMTAPVARAVRASGPRRYRRLLLAAGAAGQHIATAAATHGLFCRPVRNVREAAIEAAAGAPASHDFLYLLLIGRSRVRDFAYDLTHPQLTLSTGDNHEHNP